MALPGKTLQNFLSIHGRLMGLFRGLITPGDAVIGGDYDPSTNIGFHGVLFSAEDTITAHAGGGQTNATPLTAFMNRVTTVATAGDSVALPPSQPGMSISIINDGANSCKVYGNATEGATIDGTATGAGNSLAAAHRGEYVCVTQGAWQSYGGAAAA